MTPVRPSGTVMSAHYLEDVPSGPLQVAVVGKDPFPTAATQIPFCKPTWREQLAMNCSGRYVLASLGIKLSEAEGVYERPQDLFEALRSVGIVFLNASHSEIGGTISRSKHLPLLAETYAANKPFLHAAKSVILCGEAWKIRWVEPTLRGDVSIHPDVRNKHNPRTKERWKQSWEEKALFSRLGLFLPIRTRQ